MLINYPNPPDEQCNEHGAGDYPCPAINISLARPVIAGVMSPKPNSATGPHMEIREYCAADHDSVVALWDSVFPNSTGHNEPRGAIERKLAVDDGLFFVAADADTIIGGVLAGYDGHRGWIYSLAVAPESRRCGIGSQLVRHAERQLLRLGCPKVNLQVRADNSNVIAFYESLGFHTEDRISMGKLTSDD